MKSLLTPRNVSALQPFQPGTLQALEKVELAGVHANTSKDGKVTWIYHGPSLEVLLTNTRDRLASWQFGAILRDEGSFITSVKELSYEGSLKLLVGHNTSIGQGMVSVLDIGTSQVIKTIEIPHKVSCVEPVLNCGGESVPEWAVSEQLRTFYGVVAVGTQGGYIYLIDLNLDDYDETSDEVSPSSLQFVTPRCRNVKELREQALPRGQHLCLVLDESSHSKGEYFFRRPDDSIVKVFEIDTVSVTCLKYIPQDGNLAVGFSFGGFQLWRLYAPVLEYTSRLEAEPAAVSHFLYQEPENDPKNFCYIWVGRDNSIIHIGQESISIISLYQLSYGKKTWYASYGVFYEELHSVCLRIEHSLAADPYSSSTRSTWMSQLISCYTLSDHRYSPPALLSDNESFEESVHGPDLSLCVFVWEVQDNSPGDKSLFYLGVFDMNRWYHAQMPVTIRIRESTMDMCSFFAVHQLSDLCDIANPDSLLHVEIKVDSLKRYINNSPLTPEQHFYPSALAFEAVCVFETGIITASFHGRQRQVLYDMEAKGAATLLQPQDLYNVCLCAGLLPRDLTAHTTSVVQQRHSLLNMALEHSMLKFINSCISSWASGEFIQQGCTLKFLLDWTWERVASTKQTIDNVCIPLYDWSGNLVDHRMLQVLHRSKVTLNHLRSIMLTLLTQSAPTTEQGVEELETRLNVIHFLSQHLQLVLWFIDAGLLPESDEVGDEVDGLFQYPAGNLIQAFNSRRAELHKLHSEIQPTDLLLIDGLVSCCGDAITNLWEHDGGSGLYPPPSLHALLNMYLLEEVSIGVKHSIVFYLLLDLASLVEEDKHEQFADKIAKFAKSFSLPLAVVKQIQAFWLLDHKDFEEAFIHLLHPMTTLQLGRWQQTRIIKSLLYQGESKMALRYINLRSVSIPSQEDIKLKLTVLLANGLITEAFEYQRACRDRNNMANLLQHLFLGCQQTRTVDQLLQMPLTSVEEHHLEDYLLESSEPHSAELLVMHYLQRARYIEAIRLNEKIKHRVMTETSAKARERAAARNSIVDGFFRTLPAPQRKLVVDHPSMPRKSSGRKIDVKRPKPLSTIVTQSNRSKVISHSSLVLAMMEKVNEVKQEDHDVPKKQEKELGPFLCTPITPRMKMKMSEMQDVVYPSCKSTDGPLKRLSMSVFQMTRDPAVLNSPLSVNKSLQLSQEFSRKRKAGYSTADTMSLLTTPKVRKKSPSRHSLKVPTVLRTPQSILKVRRLITKSPSPASPTLDHSDKTPKSHRPKRLGFAEKLSTKLQQTEKAASTSKQISFSSAAVTGSTTRSGSVTTTPKHLRFVEPASDDDKTPVKKSPPSPGSPSTPRSVRNRSPTPESLSPKMASRMDNLMRQPIGEERRADKIPEPVAEDDDDITFNFNPNESDEMEVDQVSETPPDLSPAVKTSSTDVKQSTSASTEEVSKQPETDEDVVDLTEADDELMVGVREKADSTQGEEPESTVNLGEVPDQGEADVTSTQTDVYCPDSSGEIELRFSPARSTRSSPSRSVCGSPTRSVRTSSRESLRVSPARTPSRESLRGSPARTPSRESVKDSTHQTSSRESLQASPARTPSRESQRVSPARTPSRESQRVSPARTPSRESQRASPAKTPSRESIEEFPSRSSRESPARSLRSSPARSTRSSPARSLRGSPSRISRESPEPSNLEIAVEDDKPSTSRKDSPTRKREQSWLKMESPVKVFDELFGESPGKSTRSVTKKIVEDVTVTTVTQVTVSRRTSRETGQASPSRSRSSRTQLAAEQTSPERPKSASPTRSGSKTRASPARRKSKKDITPEKTVDEPEETSPEVPKLASPARSTRASPARRKSKKAEETSPERAVSTSPQRQPVKPSPSRRKSKKVEDTSPERSTSRSPQREPVKPSPSRRKSKKIEEASPERAESTSPRRTKSATKASPGRRSKKEDKLSPSRMTSASPDRASTAKSTSKSPGRRRTKKEVAADESPQKATSTSPSRQSSSRTSSPAKSDVSPVRQTSASPGRRSSRAAGPKLAAKDRKKGARSDKSSPERVSSTSPGRRDSELSPSKKKSDTQDVNETSPVVTASPGRRSTRRQTDPSKSPSRGKGSRTSPTKTTKSPGRGQKKAQLTKLKNSQENDTTQTLDINTDVSESDVGPPSPVHRSPRHRSPRLMIKTLDKQQTDSEDEGEVIHVVTAPKSTTRRGAGRKKNTSADFKTPPRPSRVSVPLTPPESGKDSPGTSETELKSKKKSPGRKPAAGKHSTRTRMKDTLSVNASEPPAEETTTTGFRFSEPMSIEPDIQARLAEPGTPIKSFIFSPPISRKRSAPASVGEDPPTPVTSLLPPTVSTERTETGPSQKPKARKAVKKETTKKKKTMEPPPASPSDSPINFVSPAPERRRTRAMDRRGAASSRDETTTSAVPTRKLKTRKKVARLY